MKSDALTGVIPVLATTFSEDGQLDFRSQENLVEYLLEQGAHGLGLFGNASEVYALTETERRDLLQLIARRVADRVPLVVGTGRNGDYAAAEASREAEAAGASALMVLPPWYLKTDPEGLIRYYDCISKAVRIPLMIQDAPMVTQVTMPSELLARMAREIEHVRYVKVEAPPTAPKITEVLCTSGNRMAAFGGLNGQFLYEELERGASGSMPNSGMTAAYVRIWNAYRCGNKAHAWRLFVHTLPLMRFGLQPGLGVSAAKHDLLAAGVIRCAAVRPPSKTLSRESLKELEFLRNWINTAPDSCA
jgi:4-hydroxy-tetrahydrodipicolinate synthase